MHEWSNALTAVGLVSAACVLLFGVLTLTLTPKRLRLKGRHVLIVGGSSGIGLALAEQAVREGAHVSIAARSQKRLDEAKHRLSVIAAINEASGKPPQKLFSISVDVVDANMTEEAVRLATDHCGPVTVLICCQGIARPLSFQDSSPAILHEMMNINFWGSVNTIKATLPSLKKAASGEGRILLVSSQAAQIGVYGYAGYAASKAALRGFAECLQQELLPNHIRVGIVFPTDTDTPQLLEENKTKPEITKKISATTTVMSPEAVARVTWTGVKCGHFLIPTNFDGIMLNIATAGLAPQPQVWMMVMEVLFAGVVRVVALFTIYGFNATVLKHSKAENAKSEGDVKKMN